MGLCVNNSEIVDRRSKDQHWFIRTASYFPRLRHRLKLQYKA